MAPPAQDLKSMAFAQPMVSLLPCHWARLCFKVAEACDSTKPSPIDLLFGFVFGVWTQRADANRDSHRWFMVVLQCHTKRIESSVELWKINMFQHVHNYFCIIFRSR